MKVVEIEPSVQQRNVAGVGPVGQVDVVIGQQGFDGAAQQGREMTGQRRHDQAPFGSSRVVSLRKCSSLQKGCAATTSSLTAICLPSIVTDLMPKSGRSCDMPEWDSSSIAAAALRTQGISPIGGHGWRSQSLGCLGHQSNRPENVVLCLVGVVKHVPS